MGKMQAPDGSSKVKDIPASDFALKHGSNGTMDYTAKQDKFNSGDAGKIRRGGFKDNRYS